MADKEITIKVVTETDVDNLNDLNTILDSAKGKGEEVGEALQTAFEEATAEVERLKSELEFAEEWGFVNDVEELEPQLAEAEAEAERLGEALNNLNSEGLDNSKQNADDLSDSLGNAKQNADDLSDSMGLIESTMLMDMANQIGAIGDQAEGTAHSLDTTAISVGQLATNTGVAEPQMRNLIANISNVTFPQNEAIAYVNALNQMGVSADKLGDSATNMDRINDATGMGYTKVMQLTQGLQSVGVSANNLPSSFNAIAYAQSNVNGGAETMATVLKRQASTINEYGLNVDQLVLIMQSLSAKGVQGMKMGSELSKVLKDNNGDLSAIEQQLGLTSGALSNASQITGEYDGKLMQLADEEMEHKTLTERLGAVYEDLALQLEPVLSPMMSLVGIIGGFGQTALAINSILTLAETFGILQKATIATKLASASATIQNWLLAVSEWAVASPILVIVGLLLILIGVLVYAYFNNEQFRDAVNRLGQTLLWLAGVIYNSIVGTIQWLGTVFQNFTTQIGLNTNDWKQAIIGFLLFIPQLPLQLGIALTNAIANLLGFRGNFINYLTSAGANAVNNFLSSIGRLASGLWNELNNMLVAIDQWASTLPQKFWDAGVNAVRQFLSALGIASPGTMQRMLVWEITEMGNRVPYESRNLISNISAMGENVTDAFNPTLAINSDNTDYNFNNAEVIGEAGNGVNQINNFYFNDTVIDNEDRMEKICDYITKRINWNNTTAGRTI